MEWAVSFLASTYVQPERFRDIYEEVYVAASKCILFTLMQQGYSVSEEHWLMNKIVVFAEISGLEAINECTCVCFIIVYVVLVWYAKCFTTFTE